MEALIEEFPDIEENLFGDISEDDELVGVSFTEVPLMQVDDHYERIPVNTNPNARGTEESDQNGKGKQWLLDPYRRYLAMPSKSLVITSGSNKTSSFPSIFSKKGEVFSDICGTNVFTLGHFCHYWDKYQKTKKHLHTIL